MQVTKIDTFAGHRDCVYALEPASAPGRPDSGHFFSAGADGLVVRWQLNKPDLGTLIARIPASVYALAYDAPRNLLWVGQNYEGIHLINPDDRQEVHSAKITTAAIFDIKLIENTAWLAFSDGTVAVMDTTEAVPVMRKHLRASDKSARCLSVHWPNREVAVGYSDHHIRIFDLDRLELKRVIPAHANSVFTVQYSPDGRYLLSGSRDAHLKIWDATGQYAPVNEVVAHMFALNHLTYSPDETLLATCSMDKSIKVWDAATFRLLKVIDRARHAGHGTSVNKLWWSAYGNQLVSAGDDRLISVWEVVR